MFALRNGECFGIKAEDEYMIYGPSDHCDGKGDVDAFDAYYIGTGCDPRKYIYWLPNIFIDYQIYFLISKPWF